MSSADAEAEANMYCSLFSQCCRKLITDIIREGTISVCLQKMKQTWKAKRVAGGPLANKWQAGFGSMPSDCRAYDLNPYVAL